MLVFLVSIGCYESHLPESRDPGPDASAADVPLVDALSFDAASVDAASFDARPDVRRRDGSVACPGGLRLIDRRRVVWSAIDCGGVTLPEVVAVEGPNGPFQLVSTENRFCDDRPPSVWTRRVGVDGESLVVDAEVDSGLVRGPAYAASNGTDFAYCTGAELRMSDVSGPIATSALRPEEEPLPGCLRSVACRGLASDGVGWGATWSRFDCDVVVADLTRSNRTGGLRDEPVEVSVSLNAIATSGDGFAALSQGRGSSTFHRWPARQSGPTSVDLGSLRGPMALQAWLGTGVWAVAHATDALALRLFDEEAGVVLEREYPADTPSYDPVSIDFAAASWGGAIVVGYGWTGGRIDGGTRLVAVDTAGELLLDTVELDLGVSGETLVRVAANERDVLVHRNVGTPDPASAATEVLLYRCF
jgi:hypothetical protein